MAAFHHVAQSLHLAEDPAETPRAEEAAHGLRVSVQDSVPWGFLILVGGGGGFSCGTSCFCDNGDWSERARSLSYPESGANCKEKGCWEEKYVFVWESGCFKRRGTVFTKHMGR